MSNSQERKHPLIIVQKQPSDYHQIEGAGGSTKTFGNVNRQFRLKLKSNLASVHSYFEESFENEPTIGSGSV